MEFTAGKRPPRPTVAVLKKLPRESFSIPHQREQINAGHFADLVMYEVVHPLLDDAQKFFPDHTPSIHTAATKSAKKPVYEVRSRTGAAWRGALVRDDSRDPWLVYADRHNQFHSKVAKAMSATSPSPDLISPLQGLMPRPVEYKLRAREEALLINRQWRADILNAVTRGIANALIDNTRANQEITRQ